MKIVRFGDAPTFEPRGHAGVLNHALVSTQWHQTPEVSVWWGRFGDGGASDLHRHPGATQVYVVLAGTFVVDDGQTEHRLGARDTAIIAAGDPHRIRAEGDAEVMVVTTPGLR
ncbi:MAG: cupin domain-containing protein [Actinobacteria bacterium]|nr:cupin domain-containing protein [Actinomycetota bacterium]